MSRDIWALFRKSRRISFCVLAVLSFSLLCFFTVFLIKDFVKFTALQRIIMISLPLVYGVITIFLYLLIVVVFRPTWEFVRIGLLLVLCSLSSVLFTIVTESTKLPCISQSGSVDACYLTILGLAGSWLVTGSAVLHSVVFIFVMLCGGPYEDPVRSDSAEDLPTPSIRGLRRYSSMSTLSAGQVANTNLKQSSFRLSKPPDLRGNRNVWSPATATPARCLSPRAADHYARMGTLLKASRSGSSSSYSDKGLLDNVSQFSHARTESSNSMSELSRFRSSSVVPPTSSVDDSTRAAQRDMLVPVLFRSASVHSLGMAVDTVPSNEKAGPNSFNSTPFSIPQSINAADNVRSASLHLQPLWPCHPRQTAIRAPPIQSSSEPFFGPSSRLSTSYLDPNGQSTRIGSVQTSLAQMNDSGKSFHSISPSLHPKSTHGPVARTPVPRVPPASLVPGGGQRSIRFMSTASAISASSYPD